MNCAAICCIMFAECSHLPPPRSKVHLFGCFQRTNLFLLKARLAMLAEITCLFLITRVSKDLGDLFIPSVHSGSLSSPLFLSILCTDFCSVSFRKAVRKNSPLFLVCLLLRLVLCARLVRLLSSLAK